MEGAKTTIMFPTISHAQVIGYDSENNGVWIQMPSGQTIMLQARSLYEGNADGIRVHQKPLPYIGSWGLVCFPYGDDRFPIWLGSYYPNFINALTSGSDIDDSQLDYYSHASGYYAVLDSQGQMYLRFPDGSQISANTDNSQPTTYRHSIDPIGAQTRIVFPDDQRNPNPPPPFYLAVKHPTGASATCNPDGVIQIQQTNTPSLQTDKTTLWTLDAQGNVLVDGLTNVPYANQTKLEVDMQDKIRLFQSNPQTAHSAEIKIIDGNIFINSDNSTGGIVIQSGINSQTIEISTNADTKEIGIRTYGIGAPINIKAIGDVNIESTTGNVNITAIGDIKLNTGLHMESLDTIVASYNGHTHPDAQGGNTGVPNIPLP
jgi:hypothetical protein